MAIDSSQGKDFFKQVLNSNSGVTLEEAIFRSEKAFRPANLQECRQFWEAEILKQNLCLCQEMFCFPSVPMISRILKYLEAQRVSCVMVLPKIWAPWSNLMNQHKLASFELAPAYNSTCFTVTHPTGRRIPKIIPYIMEAVYLSFE